MADPWTGAYDPRGAEGGGNWSGFDQARSTPIPQVVNFAPGYQHSARWGTSGTPRFFTAYTGDPSSWYGQVFGNEAPEGRLARYARDEQSYGMTPEEAWQHAYGRVYRMMQETGRDPSALAAGIPEQYRAATPGAGTTAPALYDFLGRQLDPTQQLFYQTNPQLAYAYGGTQFSPNAASPRREWWDQNWGRENAAFANASVDNPNLQITEFLNQRFPQMAQEFNLLPAQARGVNAPYLPAGRPQI
jgi:hypothetical protein